MAYPFRLIPKHIAALRSKRPDWYVDSVSGNDANDGKTRFTPLRTLAALVAKGIIAGDWIALARGSHWREMLSFVPPQHNLRITAYGAGARPKIDASDVILNASFTKSGGYTNLYQVNVTPDWPATFYFCAWENDAYLRRATSLANCDSTPGTYYPSGSSGTITLYLHPFGSTNPVTDGKLYEYTQRQHAITCGGPPTDARGLYIRGIHTTSNLNNGGSLRTGENAVIIDCLVKRNGQYGLFIRDNTLVESTTIDGSYYGEAAAGLLVHSNQTTPTRKGTRFVNCSFLNSYGITLLTGYTSHNNTSGSFGVVSFSNCLFQDLTYGISDCRDVDEVIVEDSQFINCQYNKLSSSTVPGDILELVVRVRRCTWQSNVRNQRFASIETAGGRYILEDNAITNDEWISAGLVYINAQANLEARRNVFTINNNGNAGVAIAVQVATVDAVLEDNIYNGSVNWNNVYRFLAAASGMTWSSDFNAFNRNFRMDIFGTIYTDLATFQVATGQDLHSTGP